MPGAGGQDLVTPEAHHRKAERKTPQKPSTPQRHYSLPATTNVGDRGDGGSHAVSETTHIHTYTLRPWRGRTLSREGRYVCGGIEIWWKVVYKAGENLGYGESGTAGGEGGDGI